MHILFQVEEPLPGMLLVPCSGFIARPPDSIRSLGLMGYSLLFFDREV